MERHKSGSITFTLRKTVVPDFNKRDRMYCNKEHPFQPHLYTEAFSVVLPEDLLTEIAKKSAALSPDEWLEVSHED